MSSVKNLIPRLSPTYDNDQGQRSNPLVMNNQGQRSIRKRAMRVYTRKGESLETKLLISLCIIIQQYTFVNVSSSLYKHWFPFSCCLCLLLCFRFIFISCPLYIYIYNINVHVSSSSVSRRWFNFSFFVSFLVSGWMIADPVCSMFIAILIFVRCAYITHVCAC